ncbi:TPA: hypothetical protein I8Y21_005831 [Klebsiella oxytoca]|uniref:Uncharacterized protein n=1 Tax=Klebsiella oxytoca TaxID=571 RepID=A0AAN5LEN7_KLEOX|nr:hypothetical protein [Klebsiella oxytoca]
MKNKFSRKKSVEERNVSVEIYRRLNRSSRVAFALGLHVRDLKLEGDIFMLCIGDIFSYLHDDISYVLHETKKGGAYDCFLKNHKA